MRDSDTPLQSLTRTLDSDYSNKDEEMLKTYKNVYSKLLRADKSAPLLDRIQLYMDLLQQLTPQTGSDGTNKQEE